ncbi:MAG: dimethylsulfoxide reductase subunit B [Mariniphaga sp.]|nr:dimethylsulfoxide reductase subunit B [Mariniphaga sp.]
MDKQLAFYFDSSSCSGCKTCQVACKDKNDLAVGIRWRRVYEITGGSWEKENDAWISKISSYFLSMSCNHCAEPICLNTCPTAAIIKRDDGIVLIDPERCMGCRYCEWACPYGALQYDNKKGQMGKCDLCFDYLEEGKQPSCVTSCPMRVLDFGKLEDLKEKYGDSENIYPLPDPKICQPSFLITPHKDATIESYDISIENREEVKNG